MKRAAVIFSIFVFIFIWTMPLSAGELAVIKRQDSWVITDDDIAIGSLKLSPEGNYLLYGKDGAYVGLVLQSGSLKIPGTYPVVSPIVSQLHLAALRAIDMIKSQPKSPF